MAQQALTTTQKIALVLVALGAERSARVLQHLDPEQVLRIAREMAQVGEIPNQAKRAVLREFRARVSAEEEQAAGRHFAREVLDKALGNEQAQQMWREITAVDPPPSYLASVTPDRAAELLADEPPHIIVPLLAPLPEVQRAAIRERLPEALRSQLAARGADAQPPAPEVRAHLERALRAKASRRHREEHLHGQAALADILRETLEAARNADEPITDAPPHRPDAAPFAYEDLGTLDQALLREVVRRAEMADLCQALRGTDSPLREKIIAVLPMRRRVAVQNRLRASQPLSLRAIDDAQCAIARLASEHLRARAEIVAPAGEPLYA